MIPTFLQHATTCHAFLRVKFPSMSSKKRNQFSKFIMNLNEMVYKIIFSHIGSWSMTHWVLISDLPFPNYFLFVCLFLLYLRACEILVPQPGIEPRPQQWKCWILATEPLPESFLNFCFCLSFSFFRLSLPLLFPPFLPSLLLLNWLVFIWIVGGKRYIFKKDLKWQRQWLIKS